MTDRLKEFGKSITILIGFFVFQIIIYNFCFPLMKNATKTLDVFTIFLLSIILFFLFKNDMISQFKAIKKQKAKVFIRYLIIFLFANFLVYIINNILYSSLNDIATNEANNQISVLTNPYLSFISICLLAPFYEEILFRLNFKNLFKNKWIFITFTGIFFASLHLLSAQSISEILYIIPYSILGITLSYIYKDSNIIYNSILIHALNNIIQFIIILTGGI